MARTAIVLLTHVFGDEVRERYRQLVLGAQSIGATPFVFAERGTVVTGEPRASTEFYDFAAIRARARSAMGTGVVPGNGHLVALDFARRHADFDFYWFVEYDVVFTGPWSHFFDAHRDDPSDLLACHVRTHAQEPEWYWWPYLTRPDGALPAVPLRSFIPIYRLSRRALVELAVQVDRGWAGHYESIIPSVLHAASLVVTDLGGDGSFVPAGRKHRFYTDDTMRPRPPHVEPLPMPDTLYHPLKPRGHALRALWSRVRALLR
jgi:hypothetical protein